MTEDEATELFIKAILSHDGPPIAKDGDLYWGKLGNKWAVIHSIVWSDGTVKYFLDGAEIKITDEELACPVLTPDEVAEKDKEIIRLRAELAKKDRIIECKDEALADARDRELGLVIECNKLIMFYNNVVDQAFFISEEILNDRRAD